MSNKIYTVILYAECDGGENPSNLRIISEYSKEETIVKSANLIFREGRHSVFVYINGVFAYKEAEGSCYLNDEEGSLWTQEIEDEGKAIVDRIKGIVQERKAEVERVRKEQEEKRKQEAAKAAKAALESQKIRDQENLKKLLLQYPDYAKSVLRSEAAGDE